MKKSTRIVKKLLALFLVVLMSINTFAAVVGDNDGAAFITKAEFDSLKNDFQSQLDNYNSSLDNKIDGAISSYLSGINIAKTVEMSTLCYDAKGILSVRSGEQDIDWSEGLMAFNLTQFQGFNSSYGMNIGRINLKTKAATPFTEAAIINLDRANGYAVWKGLCTSTYNLSGVGWDWNTAYYNNNIGTTVYLSPYRGFYARDDEDLLNLAEREWVWCFGLFIIKDGKGTGQNYVAPEWGNTVPKRTTSSIQYPHIVLTPTSAAYSRFVDYDNWRDFCNDSSNDEHTQIGASKEWVKTLTSIVSQLPVNSGFTYYNQSRPHTDWGDGTYRDPTCGAENFRMPFFGFVSAINDWNQIATTDYDSIVSSVTNYKSNISTYNDSNGVSHLMISAGAPVVEVQKNSIIKIDIEFKDKTVNYDVWFKWNGWNKNDTIEVDDTVVPRNMIKKDRQGTTSCDSGSYGSKSIKVTNGVGTVYVTAEEAGYLFMKWSLSGNSGAGGGTWMPPKTVEVTST